MSKYDELNKLEELRDKGVLTEDEYQQEKQKVLNSSNNTNNLLGTNENSYLLLMHLSQFAGFIIFGLGFVAPIIMWATNKENPNVDKHGKNILNFMISMFIYLFISLILCFLLIGIPLLIVLGIMQFVFIIIAAVKASSGEYWKYPLSITFFS